MTIAQHQAANPHTSVWLAASAGTGKTKVLVDRLSRLLLAGVPPHRLLCLTFTNVGAAEMVDRMQQRLTRWYALPPAQLTQELTQLLGHAPTPEQATTAAQLLDQVIDPQGGGASSQSGQGWMNIRTIHSFCQSLLQQFAFEAGLPPGFSLLDDQESGRLRTQALQELLANPPADHQQVIMQAFAMLSRQHHLSTLQGILGKLLSAPPVATRIESFEAYCQAHGIDTPFVEQQEQERHSQQVMAQKADWQQLASTLLASKKVTDRRRGQSMMQLLDLGIGSHNFKQWQLVFLTKDDTIRAKLATLGWQKANPEWLAPIEEESQRLHHLVQRAQWWNDFCWKWAIGILGCFFSAQYQYLKTAQAKLDYSDLINHSHRLLQQADLQPWILMRLDQQWDHLLVDEAQDTSQQHWDIIRSLLAEISGEQQARNGENPAPPLVQKALPVQMPPARSLFVVGDVKQSIYGFQGADPASFKAARQEFQQQWQAANKPWLDVSLDLSYRSTPPILQLVNAVFNQREALYQQLGEGALLNHQAHPNRQGGGRVVLWPLCPPPPPQNFAPWTLPIRRYQRASTANRLAMFVADQIAEWLAEGRWLPSVQRAVQPRDILILMQRRTAGGASSDQNLLHQLRHALQQRGIAHSLPDSLMLATELAVQDLLALMQLLLTPDDDYSLACLLKSPLVGWDEAALFALAYHRSDTAGYHSSDRPSLWQKLRQDPAHAGLADWLQSLMAQADWLTPYQLLTQLLWQPLPAMAIQGDSAVTGWQAMVAAFGEAVGDVLTSLLSAALSYEQQHQQRGINLLEFILMIKQQRGASKRQLASTERNEVRLLTVHGAKGLQAPIVILPDTTSQPPPRLYQQWLNKLADAPLANQGDGDNGDSDDEDDTNPDGSEGGGMLPSEGAESVEIDDPEPISEAEIQRTLYVALTRAQDELYITGLQPKKKSSKPSWYSTILSAVTALAESGQASVQDFSYRFPIESPPAVPLASPTASGQSEGQTDIGDADKAAVWQGSFYEIRQG
jgi:ATP-dependent helicase/nuclease subunit A